ncbi:MAG: hypothetical protein QNI99_08845 [Woeseiaceae bacterium]|nr:hypothetical protein [Woeseiaceae bacterium]
MFDDTKKREVLEPNKSTLQPDGSGRDDRYFEIWDEEISGMRVEVGGREVADFLTGCRFKDCVIRMQGPLGRMKTYLKDCVFEDCLMWPARRLSMGTWPADFIGCKFKGRWSFRVGGRFEDCDLREANIERLELMQSTGPGCQWPSFPHVIIRDIAKHYSDWASTPILKDYGLVYGPAHVQPKTLVLDLQQGFDDPELAWEQLSEKPWASRAD